MKRIMPTQQSYDGKLYNIHITYDDYGYPIKQETVYIEEGIPAEPQILVDFRPSFGHLWYVSHYTREIYAKKCSQGCSACNKSIKISAKKFRF